MTIGIRPEDRYDIVCGSGGCLLRKPPHTSDRWKNALKREKLRDKSKPKPKPL